MDNFDKLFQDKLSEITENDFEFKDSSWERFQNGWSKKEETRGFIPFFLAKRNAAAAAIIVFLLMGNVFFAQQFLSTRTDMKKLTSMVEELRGDIVSCKESSEIHTKAVASLETKVQKQAIVIEEQTELINHQQNQNFLNQNRVSLLPIFPNQNRIISNDNGTFDGTNITNNSTSNGTLNTNNNESRKEENNPNQPTNTGNDIGKIVDNQSTNNNTGENSNKSTTDNNAEVANNTSENGTNKVPKSIDELNRLLLTLNENKVKVTIKKREVPKIENDYKISAATRLNMLAEDAKPSAYQLGIQSKFTLLPTFSNLPAMTMTNNGVIANALFFNNFRLQIGANQWGQFFKVEDVETLADGIVTPFIDEYPVVTPVSGLDELTKVETKIYGFDLPINAQVLLRPNAKLNPYIGFGINGRYVNNYQLEYYFIDYNTNYDYEIKNEAKVNNLSFSIWQSQLGMDYSITDNWLVNFEINYLKSFKEQAFGLKNTQQYGASLGVKYEF